MDVTTDDAAERLGVSRRRVVEMLRLGELAGKRVHRTWIVDLASVQDKVLTRGTGGRPLSAESARTIIELLSFGGSGDKKKLRNKAMLRSTPSFAAALAQAVVVRRFETRRPELAAPHLHPTGESALDALTEGLGEELVGSSRAIHGYLRDISLDELIDEAMLVPSGSGDVAVYGFRDGVFPWDDTPRALIAVDASRSRYARVRDAGLRALDHMRSPWVDSAM